VGAIVGQRLFPGLLDRYFARTGYRAQQTSEPADPGRPDNLDEPFPADLGTHGRFDDEAKNRSAQAWASAHRVALLAASASAGLVATALTRSRR
jgi:hypothetical protein